MDLSIQRVVEGRDDQSWLGSAHGTSSARTITLQMSSFTASTHYPNGYFPSGLPLAQFASGSNAGRYGPQTDTGASRTVTDGATTAASTTVTSATAAFTASDVGSGITGGSIPAGTTIVSVTNATTAVLSAAPTVTATGVSLTIAAPVSGLATLAGFLFTAVQVPRNSASGTVGAALLDHGRVRLARLPIAPSATAQATNAHIIYV